MQAFERGTLEQDFNRALLLIMCALAARTTFMLLQNNQLPNIPEHQPGALWAEEAQALAFKDIGHPSVSNLMVCSTDFEIISSS